MFPYKASQLTGSAGHLTNEVKALQEELNEATHSLKQTNRAYLEQRVELSRAKQTITELKQTLTERKFATATQQTSKADNEMLVETGGRLLQALADNAMLRAMLDPSKAAKAMTLCEQELKELDRFRGIELHNKTKRLDYLLRLRDREIAFMEARPVEESAWDKEMSEEMHYFMTRNRGMQMEAELEKTKDKLLMSDGANAALVELQKRHYDDVKELNREIALLKCGRLTMTPREIKHYAALKAIEPRLRELHADEEGDRLRAELAQAKQMIERMQLAGDHYEIDGQPKWTTWQRKYYEELDCDATGEPITDALGNATLKRVAVERKLEETHAELTQYKFRFGELNTLAPMNTE